MTIIHAISIVNDGVGTAGVGVSSGNAITINAGPSDSVHLRGLTIGGLGSGQNGIQFNSGGNLAIENCIIRGFTNAGINISPSTSSSFSVSNTIASNNNGSGIGFGIVVQPTGSAVVSGMLSNVAANNNSVDGIVVNGSATTGASLNVTIVDSEASNNGNDGVQAFSPPGGPTATGVMVRNVVSSNNGNEGLVADGSILRVAHSVVTDNGTGVSAASGTIFSYGDNDIDGNIIDNTAALTPLAMH